jgi:hypothetical protein
VFCGWSFANEEVDGMTNAGNPEEEYKELNENMRHYANMRFAQLTVFSALEGALVSLGKGCFTLAPKAPEAYGFLALSLVGLLIAVVFLVMEERAADYWHHFRRRAVELEGQLGYRQFTDRPLGKLKGTLTATNAVRALYIVAILFWVFWVVTSLVALF